MIVQTELVMRAIYFGSGALPHYLYISKVVACSECARLLVEYERLTVVHKRAQHARIAATAQASAEEYMALRATADEAWMDLECARLEVDQHRRIHAGAD